MNSGSSPCSGSPNPLVSLVVGTLGRSSELVRLFDSLRVQTYKEFEVIIVDQNRDDRAERVTGTHGHGLALRLIRSERGLSRARNLGLRFADGEIIGFPDDDCWYPPDLLERVVALLNAEPLNGGLSGRCVSECGENWSRFDKVAGHLAPLNVLTRATAAAMFLRGGVLQDVGGFDERMGVGAGTPFQSAEEMDCLLRVLARGHRLVYAPSVCVFHEPAVLEHGPASWTRARDYGRGLGYLLRRHRYPVWFKLYLVSRAVGGLCVSLALGDLARARYYFHSAAGRVSGWLGSE